jgi:hypothetical protein
MTPNTYMNTREAAEYFDSIGIKGKFAVRTLAKKRTTGGGPPYIEVAGSVFYTKAMIDKWLSEAPVRKSNSEK